MTLRTPTKSLQAARISFFLSTSSAPLVETATAKRRHDLGQVQIIFHVMIIWWRLFLCTNYQDAFLVRHGSSRQVHKLRTEVVALKRAVSSASSVLRLSGVRTSLCLLLAASFCCSSVVDSGVLEGASSSVKTAQGKLDQSINYSAPMCIDILHSPASVARLVVHCPAELGVVGSIPGWGR